MKAAFRHIAGSKNGLVERFDLDRIRIGRDPSNDLRFDPYLDRDASGFHGEIYEEEGKVWIHDLGSTNGTYVNGEKTARKSLEAGDLVEFGRHGPKVRFFLGDVPEGAADAAGAGAGAGDAKRGVGVQTVHAIVDEAVKKAKSGGTAVYIRNAVREAVKESSRRSRLVVLPLAALVLAVAGGAGALLWVQAQRIRDQERQMREKEEALKEALQAAKSTEEVLLAFQEQFRGQFLTAQQEEEDRRRQHEENLKRIERMEILLQGMKAAPTKKGEDVQQALLRAKNERAIFQEIEKVSEPSLFLVFTSFKTKGKDAAEKTFQCFGTAFTATREGHLFTNKHVVQPWKFSAHKIQMEKEGLELIEDSVLIAAWKAGSQVYVRKAGSWMLNLETGYNNKGLRNLEVFTTAPDHMDWITISPSGDEDGESEGTKVHAHLHDNNDLAVLKITDKFGEFRPVRVATAEEAEKLQKLDPVLAVGFPRGGGLLERGIAEPTASRGDIRKIENSILISAPIIGGNSGGPVFSEDGAVIGVSTRTVKGAETFGFCVPIQNAVALLPPEYR